MTSVKAVALVLFLVFCASGGPGVLLEEMKPGWFPVPLSFRVGRVVELVFCMLFYGFEVIGLINVSVSVVDGEVDEHKNMAGLYLLCFGMVGHWALFIMFS